MTRSMIRTKALLAAGSVVLALGTGCDNSIKTLIGGGVLDTDAVLDTADIEPDCVGAEGFECCEERRAWCDEAFASQNRVDRCVFGQDFDGSTGCIPWGPPAPPVFSLA